jgi:phosphoglycolate phosphatase
MIGKGAQKLIERGFHESGRNLSPDESKKLIPLFIEIYTDCATDHSRPFPQIVSTLTRLQQMNIPMGVCTNKPEMLARRVIEGLELSKYFKSIIGGDTTSTNKPDPQPLLRCLQEIGSSPQTSLMIGDSSVDVAAARATGVAVAVVPWGYRTQSVESLAADYIFEDLSELLKVVHSGQQ